MEGGNLVKPLPSLVIYNLILSKTAALSVKIAQNSEYVAD